MPSQFWTSDWRRVLSRRLLSVMLVLISVTACAPSYQVASVPGAEPPLPPPQVKVYFYPNKSQSLVQQDRDRYECYLWAKEQTGFDPSAPALAPHNRIVVVPEPPPGTGTAVGAVTGALLGAAVASHHNKPEGALVGAVAGGIIGSTADVASQEQASRLQRYYDQQADQRAAVNERQAADYRRALTACLEGRDYTVR